MECYKWQPGGKKSKKFTRALLEEREGKRGLKIMQLTCREREGSSNSKLREKKGVGGKKEEVGMGFSRE